MRKIIVLFFIFSVQFTSLRAQINISGGTYIWTSDPCNMSEAPLTIKNNSPDTLNILCQKIIVDTTAGTDLSFCWGGDCYPEFVYESGSYNTLAPGEEDNIDFKGYYEAYCELFPATVKYCFYPNTDPTDSSCITIVYHAHLISTIEETAIFNISEFYPNPANEYIAIKYNLEYENSYLTLIDVLGNKVKDIQLNSSGKQNIYVGDLNKGVYFGNLMNNKKVIAVRKLVVK